INNLASNLQAIINKSKKVRGIEDLLSNANDSGPSKQDENLMSWMTTEGYAKAPDCIMILAHGAGAPMDSTFMEALADSLDREGIACVRFEFPYMIKRRADGRKRPPDRAPVLLDAFREAVAKVRSEQGQGCKLLVGGKSMGGRMASLLASEDIGGIDGVACYGYPFHPPGKMDRWRIDHFETLQCPLLVIQGTRDPFGKPAEIASVGAISGLTRLIWLEGGNHDFQPLKKQPETQVQLIARAASETRRFVEECLLDR
ncbi:MAG: Uncharacterized protein AWU57_3056, partial [Marinobacter sp. T13-3]